MELKPGYKHSAAGVIPEDWQVVDFSEFCQLQRGFDITEATRVPGAVPVYSSSGISYHHSQARVAAPGVVTGRKGVLGKVFYVAESFWPHDTTLWVKDFRGNVPAYTYWVLVAFRLERFDAATSVPTLNRNNLTGIRLAVPSPREQQAIATALNDAAAMTAALDVLLGKKRDIKQAAMQLLTGRLRLLGFTGKWNTAHLAQLGSFSKGKGITRGELVADGLPCVRYGEIYTRHHDHIRKFYSYIPDVIGRQSQRIRKGDLLFAASGETAEEIGKCAAFLGNEEAYAGGDIIILSPSGQDSAFLGYLLNQPSVAREKARMGQGDAVVHISTRSLAQLTVSLPPIEEQAAIAGVLSDMDAEIAALEAQRDKTLALKQGMMQELLTGRTRLV